MNNFNVEFIKKLKKEKFPLDILKIDYFKSLNSEELYNLLKYKSSKFKQYINLIIKFNQKGVLISQNDDLNVKKLMNILFNVEGLKNNSILINLLFNTNLIHNNYLFNFVYAFLNLKENYKVKAIKNIIVNVNNIENVNIEKILFNISNCSNISQVRSLEYLFQIDGIFEKQSLLQKVVYLIIENPKFKYLEQIVYALDTKTLFDNKDAFLLVSYFFKACEKEQIDLIYSIVTNPLMLELNYTLLLEVLDIVIDKQNKELLPYIESLVENISIMTNTYFEKFLDSLLYTSNNYQREGIINLIDYTDIIIDYYKLSLIIDKILIAKKDFQVLSILELAKRDNLLESVRINFILDSLLNATKYYQNDCILNSIDSLINTSYYKEIINSIITTNNYNTCEYITMLLKHHEILARYDFIEIFNVLMSLKHDYQMDTLLSLIKIEKFEHKNLFLLKYLKNANIKQCKLILMLIENTDILEDELNVRLIKYLFTFKDNKRLNLIAKILFNINLIGFINAIEYINIIIVSEDNLEAISEIINSYSIEFEENNKKKKI